jgi:hypothetical protein
MKLAPIALLFVAGLLPACEVETDPSGSDVLLGGFSTRIDGEVERAFQSGQTALARLSIELAPLRDRESETTVFVEGSEILVRFEPHPDDRADTQVTAMCRCQWTVPEFLLLEIGRQAEQDGFAFDSPGVPTRYEDVPDAASPTLGALKRRRKE